MNEPAPLTQLGRYRIVRVVGRGAMGIVYEGIDPRLNRQVAVKTIRKSELSDPAAVADYSERFVREARAAARLHHPNIVTIFDFGEEGEVAYIVMEFIHGRELKSYFDSGDFFELPDAVRIMCELFDALGYAHEHGIVHRDIKPANVMLDPQHRVKLTDFGVARVADSSQDRTLAGTVVGTPSYMSPEQIQGRAVGSRSDLFAAGVILYQFLTHKRPFSGPAQWTIQMQIVQDDPKPPSFVNEAVPPVFDEIIRRALAKDPAHRYSSAAEFATDLKRALALAMIPNEQTMFAAAYQAKAAGPAETTTHESASEAATVVSAARHTSAPKDIRADEPTLQPLSEAGRSIGETRAVFEPAKQPSETRRPEVREHGARHAQKLGGVIRRNAAWLVGGSISIGVAAILIAYGTQPLRMAAKVESVPLTKEVVPPPSVPPAMPQAERAPRAAQERESVPVTPESSAGADAPSQALSARANSESQPRVPSSLPATAPKADNQRAPALPGKADVAATKPTRAIEGNPPARKPEPKVTAPAKVADGARRQRCDDYLQRLQIGDILSDADQTFFQRECKR